MSLVDTFPEDPSIPSLRYAAIQQVPITIPWGVKKTIALGTGFNTSKASSNAPFLKANAFAVGYLDRYRPRFRALHGGDYVESNATSHGSKADHAGLSLAISIGGSFLGASGRGTYESRELSNNDAQGSSIKSSCFAGLIMTDTCPDLSSEAKQLLSRELNGDKDVVHVFREQFGDYFVSALRIGAANATTISSSSDSSSSSKDIIADATVTILGFDTDKHWESHERAASFQGQVSLNAYDSLDNWTGRESGVGEAGYRRVQPITSKNLARSQSVASRVHQKLRNLGVDDGQVLSSDLCDKICQEGLVVEIILSPFAGLRDYIESRLNIGLF